MCAGCGVLSPCVLAWRTPLRITGTPRMRGARPTRHAGSSADLRRGAAAQRRGGLRGAAALLVTISLVLLPVDVVSAAGNISGLSAEPSQRWHLDFDTAWPPDGIHSPLGSKRQPPPQPASTIVLASGEYLSVGQSATSPNGWYRLTLESDGRLTLRATDDGLGRYGLLWSTGPVEAAMPLLVMRANGELALFDTARPGFGDGTSQGAAARLWTSDTRSESGATLMLDNSGALSVITPHGRALWHSGNSLPDVGLAGTRHVVYDRGNQWVWLVDADGYVVDNYPVSGHAESPVPGRYAVTTKSEDAISYNWLVTMEHMVRFTTDEDGDWIGFHSIPRGWRDTPVQSESELGDFLSLGCVRQRDDKAAQLYEWTSIGTPVIVLA